MSTQPVFLPGPTRGPGAATRRRTSVAGGLWALGVAARPVLGERPDNAENGHTSSYLARALQGRPPVGPCHHQPVATALCVPFVLSGTVPVLCPHSGLTRVPPQSPLPCVLTKVGRGRDSDATALIRGPGGGTEAEWGGWSWQTEQMGGGEDGVSDRAPQQPWTQSRVVGLGWEMALKTPRNHTLCFGFFWYWELNSGPYTCQAGPRSGLLSYIPGPGTTFYKTTRGVHTARSLRKHSEL